MEQAEASDVAASCHGGDHGGGAVPVTEAGSAVVGDEYVMASAADDMDAGASSESTCMYLTAGMSEEEIRAAIETSKMHGWTELKEGMQDGAAESRGDDVRVWKEMKRSYRLVFRDLVESWLTVGKVIGRGGQATIYEAKYCESDMVLKVFDTEGFSLADFQRQWPRTTKTPSKHGYSTEGRRGFSSGGIIFNEILMCCSLIHFGTILKDGRFAILMERYYCDLRAYIDLKLKDNSQGPPFSQRQAGIFMWDIAVGVKVLHDRGVLHKDLKAANIFVKKNSDMHCHVGDFECAMFVQGTGFWRAPEVLEDLLRQPKDRNENIWTEKVDMYGFGMTCYEILTGHTPFFDKSYTKSDWHRVICGERPDLPCYVDPRLGDIVKRCWHNVPSERPSIDVILAELYDATGLTGVGRRAELEVLTGVGRRSDLADLTGVGRRADCFNFGNWVRVPWKLSWR